MTFYNNYKQIKPGKMHSHTVVSGGLNLVVSDGFSERLDSDVIWLFRKLFC